MQLSCKDKGGRLVMHRAAGTRHLMSGLAAGAACMAGSADAVHGYLVCCLLRRLYREAGRRADEEGQQAEDRNEIGERALHPVPVETDQRGIRYTTGIVYLARRGYADQREEVSSLLVRIAGDENLSSRVRRSRGSTRFASGSRATTAHASRTLRTQAITSWNCSTDS